MRRNRRNIARCNSLQFANATLAVHKRRHDFYANGMSERLKNIRKRSRALFRYFYVFTIFGTCFCHAENHFDVYKNVKPIFISFAARPTRTEPRKNTKKLTVKITESFHYKSLAEDA